MDTIDYKRNRPKRSVLFSVAPIGLGTDSAESLESYTCRLAQAHFTTRSAVERIVKLAGSPLYLDTSGPPRLDSPTEAAHRFGQKLAELTMRQDVLRLGLGRLAGHISTMYTLRKYRAWCGDCFCEARANNLPPHLPLLWSLADYHRCLKHGQVLESHCPCCKKQSVASNSWSWAIDHCPWCNKDLAIRRLGAAPSFQHLARRCDVELDMIGARTLGEFVSDITQTRNSPAECNAATVVDLAVMRGQARHRSDFAVKAGVSRATLQSSVDGTNKPSLAILTRIAYTANVSLAGLLYPQYAREGVREEPSKAIPSPSRLRKHRSHNWTAIREEVARAIGAGEDVTIAKLARELMVDHSYLATRIGTLRSELVQASRQMRQAKRLERVKKLADAARRTYAELVAQRLTPSARRIANVLHVAHTSPVVRDAFKLMRSTSPCSGASGFKSERQSNQGPA